MMIAPSEITADMRDITDLWRQATGDHVHAAFAHMRGDRLSTVTVHHEMPLAMCRNGAVHMISQDAVNAIESGECPCLHAVQRRS